MNRVGDIEIRQDLEHQQLEWRLEWIIWSFLTLVIVGALFGLFGAGGFSSAHVETKQLRVDYEQFGRRQAPEIMRLHLRPAGKDTVVRFRLNRAFIDNIDLQDISPVPERVESEAAHVAYLFRRGTVSSDSLTVTISYLPRIFGVLHVLVQAEEYPALQFSEFVYP